MVDFRIQKKMIKTYSGATSEEIRGKLKSESLNWWIQICQTLFAIFLHQIWTTAIPMLQLFVSSVKFFSFV